MSKNNYHSLEAIARALENETTADSILEPLEDRSQFPFNLRIGWRDKTTGKEWWLLIRSGPLCEEAQRRKERKSETGQMFTDVEDMLNDICETVAGERESRVALAEERPYYPIHPVENVLELKLGFQHEGTGQEWWIRTKHIKGSSCPFKRFFTTREGREKLAVCMPGLFFTKPEDVERIDWKKTRKSFLAVWEFEEEE